jgi:hypothetical protein
MYSEALTMWNQKCNLTGEMEYAREMHKLYKRSGYPGILQAELNYELAARASGEYSNPVGIAEDYAALGDTPHALEWLQKAYEEHSSGMQFLNTDAHFDSLRSNPKFQYWLDILALPSPIGANPTVSLSPSRMQNAPVSH